MTNSLYTTSQSESLIFAQPDTSEESSFIKILNILIGPLKSGGFFCSVLRSVLGSVLKSVIDLKNGLTIIYSHALRKSKLFRKDVYHFNSF